MRKNSGFVIVLIMSILALITISTGLLFRHATYNVLLARKQAFFYTITSLTQTLVEWTLLVVRHNFDVLYNQLYQAGSSKTYVLEKWPVTKQVIGHDLRAVVILSCKNNNAIEVKGYFVNPQGGAHPIVAATLTRVLDADCDQKNNPLYHYYVMNETINP